MVGFFRRHWLTDCSFVVGETLLGNCFAGRVHRACLYL